MKIRELIKVLEKYNPELDVLINGYEQGIDDLSESQIGEVHYIKNVHKEYYNGKHEIFDNYFGEKTNKVVHTGVLLSRYEMKSLYIEETSCPFFPPLTKKDN